MSVLGPDRKLVLVNTFVPRPWEHEVNGTLAAAASRYPNVVLANWWQAIDHRTKLLWEDGIHPQPSGGKVYARTVAAAIQSTEQTTTASPSPDTQTLLPALAGATAIARPAKLTG
jgi:hypothetical protein